MRVKLRQAVDLIRERVTSSDDGRLRVITEVYDTTPARHGHRSLDGFREEVERLRRQVGGVSAQG